MQDFIDKKILLGISGGIAAYKSAYLIREFKKLGAEVRVIMTESAQKFITPMTLQALSGHEVHLDVFDEAQELAMGHIELSRWADYFIVAPASANCIAKLAQGLADDLLSTVYLASTKPFILCPGMNQNMWQHPATQANVATLQARGAIMVGPDEGEQACGDYGFGRLAEISTIINALRLVSVAHLLAGQKVLITAGGTREYIDPARFLSNASSGKMGFALAEAAQCAGAEVTLITGPTALEPPSGVECISVVNAEEMYKETMAKLQTGMVFIGCAAVADYSPEAPVLKKIKKEDNAELMLKLKKNADILKAVAKSGKASFVAGFAAETDNLIANAQKKLEEKQLDMIIANAIAPGIGFESDDNEVTVLTKNKQIKINKDNKIRLAGQIIAILAASLQNHPLLKEQP